MLLNVSVVWVFISTLLALILGVGIGFVLKTYIRDKKFDDRKSEAQKIVDDAKIEAERLKKESIQEAKETVSDMKRDAEIDIKERKDVVVELENKLNVREDTLDRRSSNLDRREEILNDKENRLDSKKTELEQLNNKVEEVLKQQETKLEEISNLTREQAKELIMNKVHEDVSSEIASYIKEEEEKAKLEVKNKAKDILSVAIQKYAGETVSETTVATVALPSDEMKGRIIGREGRNIRTIETMTGADLIIDDTPDAVVISSFDPIRREIARKSLEILISDGRIHPGRIEEIYDKTCKEINAKIIEKGEEAIFGLGISKIDPELVEIIGKLHFRTSYGQNALQHSIEVANLTGLLAAEVGENVSLAKRAGLLHDIGKAIDFEAEGSHVEIGEKIAKKYDEDEVVINAIASHHGDTPATSIISSLVAIADTISASRPGARNDSLENYVKRLQQLEEIANSFDGVEKSFAMQAGRDLRVIVKPEDMDELTSIKVARDIKDRIENEMQYPGTIRITVIRETRAVEEAR